MLSVLERQQAIAINSLYYEDIGLKDLKQRLPLGLWLPGGKRIREYTLNTYNGYSDLSLGALEDANEGDPNRHNRIHCYFLPEMLKAIEGYLPETLASQSNQSLPQFISNLYLADVVALILNIRLWVMGADIALSGTCPCPKQFKIQGGERHGYHDLESVVVRTLPDEFTSPPIFRIDLEDGFNWEGIHQDAIYVEPPRFYQIQELAQELLPLDIRLLFACSVYPKVTPSVYWQLSPNDIEIVQRDIEMIYFGADRKLEMDCPECGFEWDQPLDYGGLYEDFYCSLLCAPRMKREIGGTEAYLDEIAFALSYGEDVSMSREDVLKMSPKSRDRNIEKVSEQRRKQKEEMDKANAKSKAKSKR